MKRFATLSAITAMALTMTACDPAANIHEADVKAIQDSEAQWNQEYAAKDLEKIVAHYADDAILMVSGTPSTSGKEAIRAALKEMVADPALSLQFHATKVEVAKSGDVAYTQGAYTMTVTDPKTKQVRLVSELTDGELIEHAVRLASEQQTGAVAQAEAA